VTPTATSTPGTSVGTVVNTGGDNLRCRTTPVTGATIVLLAPGTQVTVRGAQQNGWYPVVCGGQNGWVSAQYLSVGGGSTPTPTSTPTQTPTATPDPGAQFGTVSNTGGGNLNCRTAPVSGAVIVQLGPGTQVQLRGAVSNGWYPVVCGGQNGWVSAQYLTVSGGTPGTTVAYVDTEGMQRANCRSQPNTSASVLTTLAWGSAVTVRGESANGWTPVRCANQDGYISSILLSSQSPVSVADIRLAESPGGDAFLG
jgi:uncharacterized protein YgiM (DUF1202 family)